MLRQELFYPQIAVDIGDYRFSRGIALKIHSADTQGYDWGKVTFTDPYQHAVTFAGDEEVTVWMGYAGKLEDVFHGNLVRPYNGADDKNGLLFKDRMLLLERTIITDTYLKCTPQDILRSGLRRAGVQHYQLQDEVYPIKPIVPVVRKHMLQMLKQINQVWNLDVQGAFIKGVFYWGVKPPQEQIYNFEYGSNILSLERSEGMWRLNTVSIPLQQSQVIRVTHPKVTGEFELKRVQFNTNDRGFIRTALYFKE